MNNHLHRIHPVPDIGILHRVAREGRIDEGFRGQPTKRNGMTHRPPPTGGAAALRVSRSLEHSSRLWIYMVLKFAYSVVCFFCLVPLKVSFRSARGLHHSHGRNWMQDGRASWGFEVDGGDLGHGSGKLRNPQTQEPWASTAAIGALPTMIAGAGAWSVLAAGSTLNVTRSSRTAQ